MGRASSSITSDEIKAVRLIEQTATIAGFYAVGKFDREAFHMEAGTLAIAYGIGHLFPADFDNVYYEYWEKRPVFDLEHVVEFRFFRTDRAGGFHVTGIDLQPWRR